MLSTPIVGGKNPERRLSLSGNPSDGKGSTGTPLKRITALRAMPSSSSLSSVMLSARKIQSGIQSGPGLRRQVV